MTLEHWALVVSLLAAIIAITSIIQAIVLRRRSKKDTDEALNFLTHLIVNSAADPDTIRRMLEDYDKSGEWRAKVSKRPDGKYGLDFAISIGGGNVKPAGKLKRRKLS